MLCYVRGLCDVPGASVGCDVKSSRCIEVVPVPRPQPLVAEDGDEGEVLLEGLDLSQGQGTHLQWPRQVGRVGVIKVHACLPRVALQRLLLELCLESFT